MSEFEKIKNLLLWYERAGINTFFNVSCPHIDAEKEKEEVNAQPADKDRLLEELRQEIGDCKRCRLHKTRTNLVFGEGNPDARLMFVGEAPGEEEDRQGRPFVGLAGQLLTRLIESVGLTREEVYIANVLKCRPPGNRNPMEDEIKACSPFLFRQIEIIQPRIICALGSFAAKLLLGQNIAISKVRGRLLKGINGYNVFPTYHPAYLLRNPRQKKTAVEDFKRIKELLEKG